MRRSWRCSGSSGNTLTGLANRGTGRGERHLIQSHVIYYAAAPYYYPGFQTTLGYNGHFGYPAAVQYADPPPVGGTHRSYAPRRGPYPEAFD
jgi:hypothetical protein